MVRRKNLELDPDREKEGCAAEGRGAQRRGRRAAGGRLVRAVNDLTDLLDAARRIAAQTRQRMASTTPDGVIIDHDVQPGNPADAPRLKPAIERIKKRTGKAPRTVGADRGYGEAGPPTSASPRSSELTLPTLSTLRPVISGWPTPRISRFDSWAMSLVGSVAMERSEISLMNLRSGTSSMGPLGKRSRACTKLQDRDHAQSAEDLWP